MSGTLETLAAVDSIADAGASDMGQVVRCAVLRDARSARRGPVSRRLDRRARQAQRWYPSHVADDLLTEVRQDVLDAGCGKSNPAAVLAAWGCESCPMSRGLASAEAAESRPRRPGSRIYDAAGRRLDLTVNGLQAAKCFGVESHFG